ncbi:MAG: hypothetical protein R3A52_01990 [Polyangiales bacterium]
MSTTSDVFGGRFFKLAASLCSRHVHTARYARPKTRAAARSRRVRQQDLARGASDHRKIAGVVDVNALNLSHEPELLFARELLDEGRELVEVRRCSVASHRPTSRTRPSATDFPPSASEPVPDVALAKLLPHWLPPYGA